MSLRDWAKAGWLKPHKTTRQQIAGLFGIVDRDLESAAEAKELAAFARELREVVVGWLDDHYPELSPWQK